MKKTLAIAFTFLMLTSAVFASPTDKTSNKTAKTVTTQPSSTSKTATASKTATTNKTATANKTTTNNATTADKPANNVEKKHHKKHHTKHHKNTPAASK